MPTRIADRLSATRHKRIVGRTEERALFQKALESREADFLVLNLYGPGGVGKSTLLHAFREAATQAQVPCVVADGRELEPTPAGFQHALGADALRLLQESAQRIVLLIDNMETLEPLEGWLREQFLPTLSSEVVCVLAGRSPVSLAWRGDLAWRGLLKLVALRNLTPDESRSLLVEQGVPDDQHEGILSFTYGYPLALSLVSDLIAQRGSLPYTQGPPLDLVPALLERFIAVVPSPIHRRALEACALVRVTTEPILARLLELPDARPYFEWLRSLSFLEEASPGLAPQDLARDALLADLRWRSPDRYTELHRSARAYYTEQLAQAEPQEQQRLLWDYIFLHRDNALVRSAFSWQSTATSYADTLQARDLPTLHDLVARYEGPDSAAIFDYWVAKRDRTTTFVFRDGSTGAISGLLLQVSVEKTTPEDHAQDPAIQCAAQSLRAQPPLRPGETATYFRFWMTAETYHGVSPVQSLIVVNFIRHYLTTPGLAYSYLPVVSPEYWHGILSYAEMRPLPEATFTSSKQRFSVYYYDWRALPPTAWLAVLAEKETSKGTLTGALERRLTPTVVLSKEAFSEAVRDALRHFHQPEALSENPLLHSRLLLERANGARTAPSARASLLRSLVRETILELNDVPKRQRAFRALDKTYLNPAPTQERAAELLDLPFSTYRRHLGEGIQSLTERLWQQELESGLK